MKKNVPVSEIMTKNPKVVHFGMKMSEVRKTMEDGGFHHVPVVSGRKLLGIISATDLLRVSFEANDPRLADTVLDHTFRIAEVMSAGLSTVGPHDTVRAAAEALASGSFHALPVVEGEDLVGIVTTTDLIKYLLEQY